jgi:hypothetical protein
MPDHRRGLSILPGVRNGKLSLIRTKATTIAVIAVRIADAAYHRRLTERFAPPIPDQGAESK